MPIPTPNPTFDVVLATASDLINQTGGWILWIVGLGIGVFVVGLVLNAVRDADVI